MNIDHVKRDCTRFKDKRILLERVEKFISPLYFSDVNLYSKLYPEKRSLDELLHIGPDSNDERATRYEEAVKKFSDLRKAQRSQHGIAKIGQSFGPTWSTHWFMANFKIPKEWKDQEVHFCWNSSSEAMIWMDGKPIQGLSGDDHQLRTDFVIPVRDRNTERCTLYIEMAANGMFGAGKDGMINPPDPDRQFTLKMAHIALFNRPAYNVIRDLNLLIQASQELPNEDPMVFEYLMVANKVVDCFQPETPNSYARAMKELSASFSCPSNTDSKCLFSVAALGNCHIDTAWLWPYRETRRKCGRSWTCAVNIVKKDVSFKFAISQAQQLVWVKEDYPTLFEDLQEFAKKGQICMVGGTWVEMDGNVPSGESFVRQFLYGQYFFKEEFGKFCDVFWLPDTFGYSAQLPQIMRGAGIKYFLSQKLSWNLFNKFPHNTFIWEGIDKSRCLAHFPPADTYESDAKPKDILKTVMNNKDKGVIRDGLLLYGYGDGGGGPTEDMVDRLHRMSELRGFPRIEFPSPREFFAKLEKECADSLHVWKGELYLELHQGTFTTHAQVKKENRQCEFALRDAEFVNSLLWTQGASYASQTLETAWKKLLLNQFHDVLPGSSIEIVYRDAHKLYREIRSHCSDVIKSAFESDKGGNQTQAEGLYFNSFSWNRTEVVEVSTAEIEPQTKKSRLDESCTSRKDDSKLRMVSIPGMSICRPIQSELNVGPLSLEYTENGFKLENKHLMAEFDVCGRLLSLFHKETNREVMGGIGNSLVLFDDIPLYWDAWDVMPYYKHSRQPVGTKQKRSIRTWVDERLRKTVEVTLNFSQTGVITQRISLDADSPYVRFSLKVDWHENRKLLRVEFPTTVNSDFATYDIQFGSIRRPTHSNTTWDSAKYEVCGHKWVDLSEYNFGVALLSDCKYGYSVRNDVITMSLLRSPKAPDANADMGTHEFSYAIMPHSGSYQEGNVIQEAYNFNHPLQCFPGSVDKDLQLKSIFTVSKPGVIIEAVKKAERKEALVVRLYESYGGTTSFALRSPLKISNIRRCDLLEIPCPDQEGTFTAGHVCEYSMQLKSFEIASLLIELKR